MDLSGTCPLTGASLYTKVTGGWLIGTLDSLKVGDSIVLAFEEENDTAQPVWVVKLGTEDTETGQTDSGQTETGTDDKTEADDKTGTDEKTGADDKTGTVNEAGNGTSGLGTDAQNAGTAGNIQIQGTDLSTLQQALEDGTSSGTGSLSGSDGSTVDSALTDEEEETVSYAVDTAVYLSIIPQNTMTVTASVDEQDILSLQTGLEAQIDVDALPGESYTGTVTRIARTSSSSSGGNSKYEMEITLTRQENMLDGMNVSASIQTGEKADVLTVPADALSEENGKTVVYTSYDEKNEELGSPAEVETGVSDGENVEILSGLEEGDGYYYLYADSIRYNFL